MAKEVLFKDPLMPVENDPNQYRQRDLSQTLFFRVACRTFGPPKSRTRRIIAPPMDKFESGKPKPEEMFLESPESSVKPDTDKRTPIHGRESSMSCADWISERKKFRTQLDNMGDVANWLQGKSLLTEIEVRMQETMSEERSKSQKSQTTIQDGDSEQHVVRSPQIQFTKPTIHQPSPEALGLLDSYLHQRRLRLVDLYNQTDKNKREKISSKDLKAVRKEAKLPISDLEAENLVISLSSKMPNSINYKELSRGRNSWRKENAEEHNRNISSKSVGYIKSQEGRRHLDRKKKNTSALSGSQAIPESTSTETPLDHSDQTVCSKSQLLEVPPINLGEMRPLSYEDMEEIGKMYKERRRRAKSNTRLLDWLEQCRLVRSGNAAVDSHSLPSTVGEEMGDLVEQHRRKCLQNYHKILKLCQEYRIPLSERILERALLFPGDKLISASGQHLSFRQPGTATFSLKDLTKPKSAGKEDSQCSLEIDTKLQKSIPSRTPYPPKSYVRKVKTKVRSNLKNKTDTLNCWITFEKFQQMTCNLRRRYPHCFLTSEDNAFWPGQLLDKLRVYLPQAEPS
ncbi:EF-hand calcium-binding domain-containing protein 12 [Pelobates fuscus]|uniref:EF-hand calcium-binding domain-containing protein 12 n=1 Tax=Pelobates fuscus TaxID=191477 RepID=UPI002FE4ECAE